MDKSVLLRDLFHRRWAMPALAMLSRLRGAKFVTLHRELGASVGSMRQAVDSLVSAGLVMKNPGYGHPMRPEYVLTVRGQAVGACCRDLWASLSSLSACEVALAKWSMPVVFALSDNALRFGEIRALCPGVTDRALTQSLKTLASGGLLERSVEDTYPPTVLYRVSDDARRLLAHLASLAEALLVCNNPYRSG